MKYLNVIAVLAILPMLAFAGNNFDDEVNAELDRMYKTSPKPENQAPVQVNVNQAQAQQQGQVQLQKQPTTYIEASPLTESRADKIRKARQEVEVQTEQKIVEKLEMSRIDDERRRSEILFGDKFNQFNNASQPQQPIVAPTPVVVAPAPIQEVVPVVVVKEEPKHDERESAHSEVTASLADLKEHEKKAEDKMYFSGLLGMSDYPDAKNLKGEYAAGFAIGKLINNQMSIEGAFVYSSYQVEQVCSVYGGASCGGGFAYGTYYPTMTKMDQYQGSIAARYLMLKGLSFRPVIGAALAYTYRSFTDTQFARYNSDATSQALDLGLITGFDVMVSDSLTLGLDYRYYTNVSNKNSGQFQQSRVFPNDPNRKPIESLNYYTLGIVGRTSF